MIASARVIAQCRFKKTLERLAGACFTWCPPLVKLLIPGSARQQIEFFETKIRPLLVESCFDCHTNGHTNASFHLNPDTRPQELRLRLSPAAAGTDGFFAALYERT